MPIVFNILNDIVVLLVEDILNYNNLMVKVRAFGIELGFTYKL